MQVLISGAISGLTLALLALGFMVVYLPCRVFFLALAGIYALVPFIALACLRHGMPVWLGAIVGLVVGAGASMLCEMFNHAPLERKGASSGAHLISSLGLFLVMIETVVLIWGNEPQVLRTGVDSVFRFGSAILLTKAQLIAGLGSMSLLAVFYLWLRFSNLGLQLRALADNPVQLSLYGYNIRRLRLIAFAVAGSLGAASALAVGYDVGFDPHSGLAALLLAIVSALIGGNTSFIAPVLGGVLLGIVRASVAWHLSARWQDAAGFLLLALFLLFRPQGLLGKKSRLEVDG